MMRSSVFLMLLSAAVCFSCNRDKADQPSGVYKLSYGDSILYLRSSGSQTYLPTEVRPGTYSAFPEGIDIDPVTGAIRVDNSETGLRYRITHTATDGTVTSTNVVLSGITFFDHYFHLSTGDSIAYPVYNASENKVLPVAGSTFDEGNNANSGGCSVRTDNGRINLSASVRNGVFGNTPQNDVRKDFDIFYRLNDGSNRSLNKLKVRMYYYEYMADVPADLLQTLQDRETDGVFLRSNQATVSMAASRIARSTKPRPPCVIIIAH